MGLEAFFAGHPVFTTDELVEYQRRYGSANRWTRKALLAYHRKQGRLIRVRRGLYAVVPRGVRPDDYTVDPYLVAARMREDAVLAYHTALELHARARSVFHVFYFLSRTPPRPMSFQSHRFRGVLFPKALRDKQREEYGVETVDRVGVDVRATCLERTLVDVLDRPDLGGGWEEVWRSLELVEFFDIDRVIEYALLLENATTAAKAGYFLEQHRNQLMVEPEQLEPLRNRRPEQPHYMDRQRQPGGRFVPEWNLVVPAVLAERAWQQPQ
jgi:predicted transcriptional regulator of viral defense system